MMLAIALAIGLLVWLQDKVYERFWHKGLRFDCQFSRKTVFEGETVTLTETLTNRGRFPLPWVAARYRVSKSLVFLDHAGQAVQRGEIRDVLFVVGSRKMRTRQTVIRCAKRGHYTISDAALSGVSLLMTRRFSKVIPAGCGLTVYPKPYDWPDLFAQHAKLAGDALTRNFVYADPFAFKGIREYHPRDSLRQINSKATAKTGQWMSNVYDHTVSRTVTIWLNLQPFSRYSRDFVHEAAIRLAAGLGRRYISLGIPVRLVCPALTDTPALATHWETFFTALAHIDLTTDPPPLTAYLSNAAPSTTTDEHSVLLISAYHGQDLRTAFTALRQSGVPIQWLLPYCASDGDVRHLDFAHGDIMFYEVKDHEI